MDRTIGDDVMNSTPDKKISAEHYKLAKAFIELFDRHLRNNNPSVWMSDRYIDAKNIKEWYEIGQKHERRDYWEMY